MDDGGCSFAPRMNDTRAAAYYVYGREEEEEVFWQIDFFAGGGVRL